MMNYVKPLMLARDVDQPKYSGILTALVGHGPGGLLFQYRSASHSAELRKFLTRT